ncbi:RES family NAD+ phosphorylase [Caballeronia zhejiangensis]|uniref:RES family NAD+ phosphorylase n=1 Tax=Caballeronia zhejiangensis TaxID=871203 RepID=UPI00158C18BC|nr:RES family NAD+ phosphorylase [Caballeronia zhejiangensis]
MGEGITASAGRFLPSPPDNLDALVKRTRWETSRPIHRVHHQQYAGNAFNPGFKGNARFSPIRTGAGYHIPTLYGGTTIECAAMETVFHDVPYAPGLKTYDKSKLETQRHTVLAPRRDLILADLSNVHLRKLGIERSQLIDTEADCYPYTRSWGAALHDQCPDIDGLCWVSRQHDRELALIIFGDRVRVEDLAHLDGPTHLTSELKLYRVILSLASELGVNLV